MPPVFVLGAPRSGTTFLASLLSNTSYGAPFETQFISKYFNKISKYNDLSKPLNFSKLVDDIASERAILQWDIKIDADDLYKIVEPNFTYSHIVDAICLKLVSSKGLERWGDKTPHYLEKPETIFNLFPDSKYLFIVRDGRDVALSLLKKNWGPNNIYACAKYWTMLNQYNNKIKEMEKSGNLLLLSYEDLQTNFDETVLKVFKHLQCELTPDVLDKLRKSMVGDNHNKWKSLMSDRQKRVFNAVASDVLTQYGYTTSHDDKINFLEKVVYQAHNSFWSLVHLFRLNTIDYFKIHVLGKDPFGD